MILGIIFSIVGLGISFFVGFRVGFLGYVDIEIGGRGREGVRVFSVYMFVIFSFGFRDSVVGLAMFYVFFGLIRWF